jgi:hypothetical protein
MYLLSKTALAVAVLITMNNAVLAQDVKRKDRPDRYYPQKWYGNGYYYGPDGAYAEMKNGRKNNYKANDFCYYEKTKNGYRPVFKRAKYSEDISRKGLLYLPKSNKD